MININTLIQAHECAKWRAFAGTSTAKNARLSIKSRMWACESLRAVVREQSRATTHEQLQGDLAQYIAECA